MPLKPHDLALILRSVAIVGEQVQRLSHPLIRRTVGRTAGHVKDLVASATAAPPPADPGPATKSEPAAPPSAPELEYASAHVLASEVAPPVAPAPLPGAPRQSERKREWVEARVPAGRVERVVGFGQLGARLALDYARQSWRRAADGSGGDGSGGDGAPGGERERGRAGEGEGSAAAAGGTATAAATATCAANGSAGPSQPHSPLSDDGANALTETLCRMRGAALKLGQMLSIQDEELLPAPLARALRDVRTSANVMPAEQLHAQLAAELGADWRAQAGAFEDAPLAAASIGQVHRSTLPTGEGAVLKVQYPGVADSIESDLSNLQWLVAPLAPKGLFLPNIIRVAREELAAECDYETEAAHQERYGALVAADAALARAFVVPRCFPQLSTRGVLATEFVDGVPFEALADAPQRDRDRVARALLTLTVKELFAWRFMQTDPNWGNYLYEPESGRVALLDFGACRDFGEEFTAAYLRIVWSAAQGDTRTLLDASAEMGFLTGEESEAMRAAHVRAGLVVGEPFRAARPFDFAQSNLTSRLAEHARGFMRERLTPPPPEIYSLHRKLAGAFLACIKLRAVIPCRDILEEAAAAARLE
eukprot:g6772.t1